MQIGAFSSKENAKRLKLQVRQLGHDVSINKVDSNGKTFFADIGIPIRYKDFAQKVLALAEPEPFTLANFITSSLYEILFDIFKNLTLFSVGLNVCKFLHIPCTSWTPFSTKSAMKAQIFIFYHYATSF